MRSKLVGRPNVYNILAAVAATSALDVPIDAIEQGLERLAGVPGRFEIASSPADDVTVVVDYAHTDDALRNLLETARPVAVRRLITVFGAGGDRDRTKRPLMGMVAARLSDVVVITSDNPRSEDPNRIIDEVKRGADSETRQSGAEVLIRPIAARPSCTPSAWRAPGDVVLIAGKGHEKYQEIGGQTFPLRRRRGGEGGIGIATAEIAGRVTALTLTLGWVAAAVGATRRTAAPTRSLVTSSPTAGRCSPGTSLSRFADRGSTDMRSSPTCSHAARSGSDRRARSGAGRRQDDRSARHARGAATTGTRGADRGRDEGHRDHGQCGEDDDEGGHRGAPGHAISWW